MSTDTFNIILIIGVILLILEIAFFNGGLIFSVIFSSVLIYFGWKKYKKFWAKIMFWIGAISLFFTVLNMMAVRFLIIAAVVLFIRHYYRSKSEPERIEPVIMEEEFPDTEGKPLIKQKFFGSEATPDRPYKWRDINIQGGIGDRIVDLSNTVLPQDEAVISIRHFVGNVLIYIPYEVEVSIHHSAIFGRAGIFQYRNKKLMNQVVSFQTPSYTLNKPRIKIITSIASGDLEVKRI